MGTAKTPWWQQATALVTVSAGGVITGLSFTPGPAAEVTAPTAVPLHLLALEQAARAGTTAVVPGIPAPAAFTAAGGIPGAGGTPGHPEGSTGQTASVPGLLLSESDSPARATGPGEAEIPGTGPAPATTAAPPRTHVTTPARPNTAPPNTRVAPATPTVGPATPGPVAPSANPASAPTPVTLSPSPSAGGTPHGGSTPATQAQRAFIALVAPGATAAQQRYGVPAAVTIAQAIDESGWGKSSLAATYHNLFGIKGTGPAGSVTLPTQEYEGGKWVTIDAQFAVYHDAAESITDHAELLATSGYYGKAMADRAQPDAFADDLAGVYATDPNYGASLIALMKLYNLYQYDTAPAPTPTTSATAAAAPTPTTSATPAAAPTPATPAAAPVPATPADTSTSAAAAAAPTPASPADTAPSGSSNADVPGLATPPPVDAALAVGLAGVGLIGTAQRRRAAPRYAEPLPPATLTALFANAKGPLARGEHLYRDVASRTNSSWKLLAAADWMQCTADPRYSPVHGEKLGTQNPDGTSYATKSAALTQCAKDLAALAARVYGIDVTAHRPLSVRELAAAFAAFRWGALLQRHGVSPMEFPYSVAGLTAAHHKMHWPPVDVPDAPDRPGSRFRDPFGAVPIVLSLGYPATV